MTVHGLKGSRFYWITPTIVRKRAHEARFTVTRYRISCRMGAVSPGDKQETVIPAGQLITHPSF
ncbi:MAG: hypothetical protein ACNA7I_01180 [Candidatus Methanoperedens sp.]